MNRKFDKEETVKLTNEKEHTVRYGHDEIEICKNIIYKHTCKVVKRKTHDHVSCDEM